MDRGSAHLALHDLHPRPLLSWWSLEVCRARFEMVNLKTPSWCGIKGAPLPGKPDYATKASEKVCDSCGTASKQVLTTGWTCLNEDCAKFSLIDKTPQVARAWNPTFINERTKWPAHIKAPMMIKPEPPTAPLGGSLMETSQQAWKGMVCRECGRCNSRTNWDEWKCATEGCTYEVPIRYNAIPSKALQCDHAFEAEGHAIPFDKYLEPVIRRDLTIYIKLVIRTEAAAVDQQLTILWISPLLI